MTIAAGSRFGPYEIVAPLGAGGMGEVYRARDVRLGREVALKVLPEEVSADRDRLARFEQEARSASALNHPNIVTIHDIGREAEVSYIAMELVEGKTVGEIVHSGPLPLRRLLSLAAQAADGLAKAHAAGIVHRDLKPENLMVTKDGFIKILDFGLAKLVPTGFEESEGSDLATVTRATEPGTVLGTVGYMSPEQASGHPVDYRSDQFSLGTILYEMATGKRAFDRPTPVQTLSAIIQEEPEPIGTANLRTPAPLRWIVERCMAKDPEERYASTRDLARDLAGLRDRVSEASGGIESIAEPIPTRRSRSNLLAAAAVVALGLVASAVVRRVLPSRAASSSPPKFHRLTFRRGGIHNARFAADGKTIYYGAWWDGDKMPRLFATRPESPESWTPDLGGGSWDIQAVSPSGELAVRSDGNRLEDKLARVPSAGGIPREVVAGVPYASADWAPDGKGLAIVRQDQGRNRLEYPIGNVLLETPDELGNPRISPQGENRISFTRVIGSAIAVALLDLPGKATRILSGGWAAISGSPCWTPDGREIWFAAQHMGEEYAIYAVDLSGKTRLVMRMPGQLELDDISKDGRLLAAHHIIMRILMGRIAGEQSDRDFSWLDDSWPVDLSPDGKTLLIGEGGQGAGSTPAVYLRKTDGSAAVRLGEGEPRAISPDGSQVLVLAEAPGAVPHLVLLPTGPGEPKTLPNDHFISFRWAQWVPDGRSIVFSAVMKDRPPRIYRKELATGREQPISPEGCDLSPLTKTVSPDGKSVVGFSADGKPALFPIGGGDPKPILGINPGERPVAWTADGRSLYVFRRPENPVKVWRIDPSTGQRQLFKEIVPAEPTVGFGIFHITPDGQSYVYSFTRGFANLYLVEGVR
jgi:eukaryotic-like serine/threonine-protein kinase